jgi:hypothetical protein
LFRKTHCAKYFNVYGESGIFPSVSESEFLHAGSGYAYAKEC